MNTCPYIAMHNNQSLYKAFLNRYRLLEYCIYNPLLITLMGFLLRKRALYVIILCKIETNCGQK